MKSRVQGIGMAGFSRVLCRGCLGLTILVALTGIGLAQTRATEFPSGPLGTALTDGNIDDAGAVDWVDGSGHPLAKTDALRNLMWTRTTPTHYGTLKFGASGQPGMRHLRLGLRAAIAVGAVLVRCDCSVSVLKPGAAYPGNPADEGEWIAAKRLVSGKLTGAEADFTTFALWTLPAVTQTRAVRFTHNAPAVDSVFSATFAGAYLLADAFVNLAPVATLAASENEPAAPLLVNEKFDNHPWDNGPAWHEPVSAAHPAWVILTWANPVTLRGLAVASAGFEAGDVETLNAAANGKPLEAPEGSWQQIVKPVSMTSQDRISLGLDWLDFGKNVTTRAIRLRITKASDERLTPTLANLTKDGARVWVGEVMAMAPLGSQDAAKLAAAAGAGAGPGGAAGPHPPIAVNFTLDQPGYVTLVIEDAKGDRVRNLVSDTWFEAGPNTVWWDGSDDLMRDKEAAKHGVYSIPTHFVPQGRYQVRGLVHGKVDLHYEFTVYNAGRPPWETPDTRGGWMTNHTAPSGALFVPGDKSPDGKPRVYLGSFFSEGLAGVQWVDLDGNRLGGKNWLGGVWTGAPFLARDAGPLATPGIAAYAGAAFSDGGHSDPTHPNGAIRLTGLTGGADKKILNVDYKLEPFLKYTDDRSPIWTLHMGGLAVYNNVAVITVTTHNEILFVDTVQGKVLGTQQVSSPRGAAFDGEGRLLVLSGQKLLRYAALPPLGRLNPASLAAPAPLIASGLEDPVGITLDAVGNIYISDRGNSHQVKVFSPAGTLVRAIGHAGKPAAGPYDPMHMNNPRGIAVDSNGHLWVAEEDFQPKRVSVWTLDGRLVKSLLGPPEYGGGATIDPEDKTKFYYHGMEFKLDWATGNSSLTSVVYRPDWDAPLPEISQLPTLALHHGGHRYFTNCYMGHATDGVRIGVAFLDGGAGAKGVSRQVAAIGSANYWGLLKKPEWKQYLPPGANLESMKPEDSILFAWSDTNGNGKVDPGELQFEKGATGWITVMPDLTMVNSDFEGKAMRYRPQSFTAEGVPVYDLKKGEVVLEGAQTPPGDGGGQVLLTGQNTVTLTAQKPFPPESVGGADAQGHGWSYPSLWPGLHPGHSAPVADRPGELIGMTHLLGGFVTPQGSDAGPMWAVNGNLGVVYLFTADGLYVTQLFQDMRTGKPWSMPVAQRNMVLNDVSMHEEDFFPSIDQTQDGKIYIVDGYKASIVRVDGLETVRRIKAAPVDVTAEEIRSAQALVLHSEALRQGIAGARPMRVGTFAAPALEALFTSANTAEWVTIDKRFAANSATAATQSIEASINVAGGRLFAAWRTSDWHLLVNSGTAENAPFKTGGALDLMIGANPQADPGRRDPVAGDVRLLVYLVNGKPRATLYRAVVPGAKEPVRFSSPSGSVSLDAMEDVTSQIQFVADKGNYAFSIPQQVLGLKPAPGEKIKGDIGVLRGDGVSTLQRVYWNNKATSIVSDLPSEAALTPNLWGDWVF